ncbi:MAG: phospholipase D-like domain-containing protein, partial [Anaerolineae bacterium]|nr:phospholipase D-like domain-containing protein [Anaerolineae bacterium]
MRILRINCRGWFFLAILIFLASACAPLSAATDVLPSDTTATDWYTVYFSQPGSGTLRGGPDAALAAAIDAARASVDAAIYDLNLWSIRDALLAAQRRGVTVRIVTESDNLDRPELQELIAAGIEVLGDRREALMHNKFVVIDRYEVWSGSMNLTLNGA